MLRVPRPAAPLLALLLACCAVNPVSGHHELLFVSPEREASEGKAAAAQVEREIGLVADPAKTAYVEQIGRRLAERSPRRDTAYRFYIADMAEPNAFALPGGYIYVSRGLLAYANSEDELAGVIGHEIGHVAARHAAQRETRAMGVGVLSAIGTIAAAVVGGSYAADAASQLGQVAGAGLIASYSRDQERQADEVGQQLEAAAGWDPQGIADFLTTLARVEKLQPGGPARRPSFLDSHPQPGERAVAARVRVPELARGSEPHIAAGRAAFLERIEGVLVGTDPAEGVFRNGLFLHPGAGFAIDFPDGWQTENGDDAVAAASPRRDALITLQRQGASGDPFDAAQRWADAHHVRFADAATTQIGGWAAFRGATAAESRQGTVAADVTWIAHPSGTYRLTAITAPSAYRSWAPTFARVAESFRALSAEERAGVRPLRLRIARARAGESLDDLGRRTGNRWKTDETAVANALPEDAQLAAGQLVKIAVESPN